MRRVRIATAALVGLACFATDARAQAPAYTESDGPALFARARDAWSAMTYPRVATYDVVVRVTQGSRTRGDRYAGVVRPASGDFRVGLFGEDELRHPYVPHGINVRWAFTLGINSGGRPVGQSGDNAGMGVGGTIVGEKPVEPFAIPQISPLYSFGVRGCAAAHVQREDDTGGLRRIGSVATVSRRYHVTYAGAETIDGDPALHLTLVPLIDPKRDRLRDLWIAPESYRVLQARVAGNFVGGAEAAVPWLIRFTSIGEATYVASETSEAPVRRGAAVFDRVEIRFERVAPDRGFTAELAFARPLAGGDLNVISEPPEAAGC